MYPRTPNLSGPVRPWAAVAALLATTPAYGADVWTEPFPGIRYLHRSTSEPKEIHALIVDLSRPEISLRATRDNEKGRTTSSFANLTGAAAAVNGDFYNTDGSYDPVGLAIGSGSAWSDDTTGHHFIACTAQKVCEIETTAQVTPPAADWESAVGGNTLLVVNGQIAQSPADDTACGSFCTTQHPRTAVGLSAGGDGLILVVVEGRQDPIFGMTTNRLAELMLELGAHTALNLDGGGSSAMVVSGARVSGRPANEPSERAVSNHLAVIYDAAQATTGRLVGFVREGDITNTAGNLVGADVVLSSGERTTTGANGMYEFAEVAAGSVDVTASHPGFSPVTMSKTITAGITNWRSIALQRVSPDAGVPDAGGVADAGAAGADAEARDAGAGDAGQGGGSADAGGPPSDDAGAPPEDLDAGAPGVEATLEGEGGSGCTCAEGQWPAPLGAGVALGALVLLLLRGAWRRSPGERR